MVACQVYRSTTHSQHLLYDEKSYLILFKCKYVIIKAICFSFCFHLKHICPPFLVAHCAGFQFPTNQFSFLNPLFDAYWFIHDHLKPAWQTHIVSTDYFSTYYFNIEETVVFSVANFAKKVNHIVRIF
jgi:hypothetical protein